MTAWTVATKKVALGLGLVVALASGAVRGADSAVAPAASKPAKPRTAKAAGKAKRAEPTKAKGAARAGARSRSAKQKGAGFATGSHPIASNVEIVPFPSHAEAARHAFAQNRRDQLADAEKAARAATQDDRWQTVLFSLRALDARGDVEACFWRVLAYYRLGEMGRARSIRQLCTFGPKEEASLDAEEALSGSLQPAAVMQEMVAAGEKPPTPVPNPAPYAGASPAHFER